MTGHFRYFKFNFAPLLDSRLRTLKGIHDGNDTIDIFKRRSNNRAQQEGDGNAF
jgi:hypothetical protein